MSGIAYFLIRDRIEEEEKEYEEKMWATFPYIVCDNDCYKCRINNGAAYDICNDPDKVKLWMHCGYHCYDCPKDIFDSCDDYFKTEYNRYSNPFDCDKPRPKIKIILP